MSVVVVSMSNHVLEFYNKCHATADGKFCGTAGGNRKGRSATQRATAAKASQRILSKSSRPSPSKPKAVARPVAPKPAPKAVAPKPKPAPPTPKPKPQPAPKPKPAPVSKGGAAGSAPAKPKVEPKPAPKPETKPATRNNRPTPRTDYGDTAKKAIALLKKKDISDHTHQELQAAIYTARGMNDKPKKVSKAELDAMADRGEVIYGSRALTGDKAAARHFIDGDKHHVGEGVYGDGTYVAVSKNKKSAHDAASEYGDNVLHIGIDPSKVANYSEIGNLSAAIVSRLYNRPQNWRHKVDAESQAWTNSTADSIIAQARKAGVKDSDLDVLTSNPGRLAALAGFDAYHANTMSNKMVSGRDDTGYIIVLNRTAVVVDRDVYDQGGNIKYGGT